MSREHDDAVNTMDPVDAYSIGRRSGLKEGVRRFAWWKDGVQYVGTTGKTLKQALEEIEKEA